MAKTKKQGWINLYKYPDTRTFVDGTYSSKEEAIDRFDHSSLTGRYIDTIQIEWEEEV